MKKVKVHIAKEVEIEIDDKFEVLDCDIADWVIRHQDGIITDKLVEECIAEVEAKVGIPFYDESKDLTEYAFCVEGKHALVEN